MTKEPFDFRQDHSIKFLEMALKSDRMEPLSGRQPRRAAPWRDQPIFGRVFNTLQF
jgi:hypothetical protein